VEIASAKAVVLRGSGDLWLGPTDCRVVVVDHRMLGARVSQSRELWGFAGWRARLPLPPEGVGLFRQEALRFEAEFQASRYQWRPDLELDIRSLFPGDSTFATNAEFSLRAVAVQDDRLGCASTQGIPRPTQEWSWGRT
jgi:hypothetical protein